MSNTESLSSEKILIGIIGKTGSGKSSFINRAIGQDVAKAGEGLESMTSEVMYHEYAHESGREVHLIDTPGFDFRNPKKEQKDSDILKMISTFLKNKYNKSKKLSGIIVLHSIDVDDVDWRAQRRNYTQLKNLRELNATMNNVIAVTSFWDVGFNESRLVTAKELRAHELQTGGGLLAEHFNGHAEFMRTGQFEDQWPSDPTFLTPQQIVDRLVLKITSPSEYQERYLRKQGKDCVWDLSRQFAAKEDLEVIFDRIREVERLRAEFATKEMLDAVAGGHADVQRELTSLQVSVKEWRQSDQEGFATKSSLEGLSTRNQDEFDRILKELSALRDAVFILQQGDRGHVADLREQLARAQRDYDAMKGECDKLRADHVQRLGESLDDANRVHEERVQKLEASAQRTEEGLATVNETVNRRWWGHRACVVQ